jgi:hypothetical protein
MTKIIFIADFFANQINGGGELNNEEVIQLLSLKQYEVLKINSNNCDLSFVKNNKENLFIIANFVMLHSSCKEYIEKNCRYIIYEHDHKYLRSRNPALYPDYVAPKSEIVNESFYKNSLSVLCQSNFHKDIIVKNIGITNIINLSGNVWSLDSLNLLRELSKVEKKDKVSIMNSNIGHKNTEYAIKYCKHKNYDYELINPCSQNQFLSRLANNKIFVFFPQTPETLSRIVVEARMANLSVITNNKVGASYEEWFYLKGEPLIDIMMSKRNDIVNIIERFIK